MTAAGSRRLEQILADGPTGDMFWMYPVTAIAYLDRGQLTDSARMALRHAWQTYMPYRGDTENHWVMYYTSLYLMAQLWPDQAGDQWYTGKSSEENLREAAGWIESWSGSLRAAARANTTAPTTWACTSSRCRTWPSGRRTRP